MGIVAVTSNRHRRSTVPKRGQTASEVRTTRKRGSVASHLMNIFLKIRWFYRYSNKIFVDLIFLEINV